MILQDLTDYYHRKCDDPDLTQRMPPFGLEQKEIPFLLEINAQGELLQLRDTRDTQGKKKVAQSFRVPIGVKRASNVAANLLWDTLEYVLGVDTKGKPQRVAEQHAAFRARLASLPISAQEDAGVQAVTRFLDNIDLALLERQPAWSDALESNALLSFRLEGDLDLVCQRPAVVKAALSIPTDVKVPQAMCLVTGEQAPVERLHASIKGVWGAQPSGASIVSFNRRAFESYGKTERQGENAPVSRAAAFAYTTALNHLLRKGSAQRIKVGDASTVFWAEKQNAFESIFGDIFKDNPDEGVPAVQALLNAVQSGKWGSSDEYTRFYILGLSPNAGRISVRFYHCVTLQEMGLRIAQHFEDLSLTRGPYDPQFPPLFHLLTAIAVQKKADNIPPNLGGAIMNTIFSGVNTPYPSLWLNVAVGRCRAEQDVNYLRAATIKACLNRQIRHAQLASPKLSLDQEFLPMLDINNSNPAYRLGRLFAVLEKIQEEAIPGINATIRDRYYSAASSTPVAVFTTLLRLKNAHLKKLTVGRINSFEKLLGEVLDPITDFPTHFSLPEQGRFALGYYHQRQDFFIKKTSDITPSLTTLSEGTLT